MNTQEQITMINETMEGMVGHVYKYGGALHRISTFRISEERGRVWIKTDKREYDRDFDSFVSFINQLVPVADDALALRNTSEGLLPAAQINSTTISTCRDIMLDTIRKVKEDASYIPQATAIKAGIDTVIEMGKTEVAQLALLYKLKKGGEL